MGKKYSITVTMTRLFEPEEPAIDRGIKAVGVGKRGSRSLTPELAQEILEELRADDVEDIKLGAFFAALCLKGISPEEKILSDIFKEPETLFDPEKLARELSRKAPAHIQEFCVRLLKGETLSEDEAYGLGLFLFSDERGDKARGLAASALRVRYETIDEYTGLLRAMNEMIDPSYRRPVPPGDPIIQISEPFDGVDHSYMITPLVAKYLQSLKYRAVSLLGRNSGPKSEFNLLDIAETVPLTFLGGNTGCRDPKPVCGWQVHQADLSAAVDEWVEFRHEMIKRPFLATLEKFLNPLNADVIVASAFHPPYGEKMLSVAERAGFPAAIIIRNGIEGSCAFALKRSTKVLCSVRQAPGHYLRHEMDISAPEILGYEVEVEEKLEHPSLEENVRLIRAFAEKGKTHNSLFDARVKVTCEGLRRALEWINEHQPKEAV